MQTPSPAHMRTSRSDDVLNSAGWCWFSVAALLATIGLTLGGCSAGTVASDLAADTEADAGTDAQVAADTAGTDVATADAAEVVDGGPDCGNGICDGLETAVHCPADCGFLFRRYDAPCALPGSRTGCAADYVCVDRSVAAGGAICVANHDVWAPMGDAHPASDFAVGAATFSDKRSGLTWTKAVLPAMDWPSALTACVTQTTDGFDDWRLPTIAELASLIDRGHEAPACTVPTISWLSGQKDYEWDCWSATPYANGGWAWFVEFYRGNVAFAASDSLLAVRCVRAAPVPTTGSGERFFKLADGLTVFDRASGLRWQWYYGADLLDRAAALSACAKNTPGLPGTGWRLPVLTELLNLADRSRVSPAIAPAFAAPNEMFWTATPAATGYGWLVDFGAGFSKRGLAQWQKRVRCVTGP